MAATPYDEVRKAAEALEPADRFRLAADLLKTVNSPTEGRPPRSVLELKGLGKDLWQGLDLPAYLRRERASWDG